MELNHLVQINVLASQQESEWASPWSFITPKKDGRVRWISNLHELNKVIQCKQYLVTIITDILCKRSGYKFFTKVDISMQYCTFELDKESQDLCTIIAPLGKYKYLRHLMGLNCSPDIAQAIMESVFSDIKDADIYIDDVGTFSNYYNHHTNILSTILCHICNNGFTINTHKCELPVYWLTPQGLRIFIGCINYYCGRWPSCANILKSLTNQSGLKKKAPISWTD
jgi:hypothetical protein